MPKLIGFFLFLGLAGLSGLPARNLAQTQPGYPMNVPTNPNLPTLFIIGDSTVRNGQGDGANGQWGWGEPLVDYFDPAKINVVNRALGGTSSRTYFNLAHWDQEKAMLKSGDFVIIQFGHNDAGPLDDAARARGTLKGVGNETQEIDNPITRQHEIVHTYGWYLKKFIADIRSAGATPILCSPIPRKIWKDGKIVRWEGYGDWVAAVAASEHVPFLDLQEIIARRYDDMGAEKVEPLFADEHTHTSRAGAELNAVSVVNGLKNLKPDPLESYFSQKALVIAPPFTSSAQVYSGISGPGGPVVGNGNGGWRSGREGVRYKGTNPKPGWQLDWDEKGTTTGSAVKEGLFPAVKPLMELHLRDTIIKLVNGIYYMTGSTGDNIWDRNDGVELWRSKDLKNWEYLGLVWSIERDGTWQKAWHTDRDGHPMRNVWAPEIQYVKGNFYIAYCMALDGTGLLVSTTGKPEGPYVSAVKPDTRLTGGIDATLFQDDDGKVYFTWGRGGTIYKMKDDMSGFEGNAHIIKYEKPADGSWTSDQIAFEGASLFKRAGKYYLTGAAFYQGRYSSVAAISDNIYGPYKQWHEAVPAGGGGNYFQDRDGNWWCTVFGNDEQVLWREKPGLVRVEFEKDGRIRISPQQPEWLLAPVAKK